MVKFQTIKQKARFILNSDDAVKTVDKLATIVITEPPVEFDATVGVIVDTLTDEIHINGHNFYPAEEVTYTTTGTAIGGLANNGVYYVIHQSDDVLKLATSPENAASETAINLTSVGAGNHTLTSSRTFDISSITNAGNIRMTAHSYMTGNPVIYRSTGLPHTVLENNREYFTIANSGTPNVVALADTIDDALRSIRIPLRSQVAVEGTVHSLNKVTQFATVGSPVVDLIREQINLPAHGFETGDKVQYKADTAAIGGLVDNEYYYVIFRDADSIRLAYSYEDAMAQPPVYININACGTGNDHSFTKVEKYVPVCSNYKFKLNTLPSNLNDKCRLSVSSFDYVSNNNTPLSSKSVGAIYMKGISPFDTFSSQGYYNGTNILSAFLGETLTYQNADIEQNSIPLPHNIANILQNGIDIFVDSKTKDGYGQDIGGDLSNNSFNLHLVVYELEDFEYISHDLKDGIKHYVPPKIFL